MRLPVRRLSDADLLHRYHCARASLDAFARATRRHGSLIRSWVGGEPVQALEHYPSGGVVDRQRGAQFFYHAHRGGAAEHGHLHLFWHATRGGRRRRLGPAPAPGVDEWPRSAPSHLLAIGLDARGLPVSLFTVNHWVTGGHWFDADTTLAMVRRFQVKGIDAHADSCAWLNAFVRLYEPAIGALLRARDRRVGPGPDARARRDDRRLEVLSSQRLDWLGDLQRLEGELTSRALLPRP